MTERRSSWDVVSALAIILILVAMLAIGLTSQRRCKAKGGEWAWTRPPAGLCLDPGSIRE